MFQKALGEREAAARTDQIRIARCCVARRQRSLGQFEAALDMKRQLLSQLERAGEVDGYVFEELAENLLALGRPDAAQPYFARAYAELAQDPWLAESEPARLRRLKTLGKRRVTSDE